MTSTVGRLARSWNSAKLGGSETTSAGVRSLSLKHLNLQALGSEPKNSQPAKPNRTSSTPATRPLAKATWQAKSPTHPFNLLTHTILASYVRPQRPRRARVVKEPRMTPRVFSKPPTTAALVAKPPTGPNTHQHVWLPKRDESYVLPEKRCKNRMNTTVTPIPGS